MKIIIILGETGSELLTDGLNQRIVKELVLNEYSVSDLARKLNSPLLKIWR